jgi:glutathione S-transferase
MHTTLARSARIRCRPSNHISVAPPAAGAPFLLLCCWQRLIKPNHLPTPMSTTTTTVRHADGTSIVVCTADVTTTASPPHDQQQPSQTPVLKLVYHNALGFRAAPIQLLLFDAGAKFEMVEPYWGGDHRVVEANPGMPAFAPPALCVGDVTIAQTPAILNYLGDTFGYGPDGGAIDRAAHLQLLLDIGDVTSELFAEVRKSPEAKAKFGQAEDGGRLKNWLQHLAKAYTRRTGGKGFLFVESRPTASDFFLLVALESFDFCYGPALLADILPGEFRPWRERMQARPSFAAYQRQAKPILFESMKNSS